MIPTCRLVVGRSSPTFGIRFGIWICLHCSRTLMPDLALLLFHFLSFLPDLSSTANRNMSAQHTSCLSILLIYWPCITLFPHFFFKYFPNFAFICCMPSFFVSQFSCAWFNFSADFAATLIVEFLFGWLCLWLLVILTDWSSAYFVFRYSAVLIISALYVASVCNRSLSPHFLFTYSPSISVFGWCILYTVSTFLVSCKFFLFFF